MRFRVPFQCSVSSVNQVMAIGAAVNAVQVDRLLSHARVAVVPDMAEHGGFRIS